MSPTGEPGLLVDAGTVASSPWRGRLVLHPTGTPAPDGVVAPVGLGPSIERGVGRLWSLFTPEAHEGPAALVTPSRFSASLRRLVDGLLPGDAQGAGPLAVEIEPSSTLWPSLYPEAFDREPAPALGPPGPVPQLVVVLGCGRSGTTWLERLLMAHPDAGGAEATESWVFAQCRWLWPELEAGLSHLSRADLARLVRTFLDDLFAATLERHRPGATHMVEKTPVHTLLLDQIAEVYPDAWFIHLVRDGRDVARSASQVPFFQCPTAADGARLWTQVLTAVRSAAPSLEQFREVRYEDLVREPVAVTHDLWRWVGLPASHGADDELTRRVGERVSIHAGTAQAVGSGSWQSLSADSLAGVYAEAGDLLLAEGYASRGDLQRAKLRPAYWKRRRAR